MNNMGSMQPNHRTTHQSSRYLRLAAVTLASFFLIANNALATDYHVAKTGNDGNSGLTLGAAFLTIQKGVDSATSPGDNVIVHAGTYTENNPSSAPGAPPAVVNAADIGIIISNGGALGNPITISAAPGEHVVIDQGNQLIDDGLGGLTIEEYQGVDGSGLTANNRRRVGFFFKQLVSFVTIAGFEIKNATTGIRAPEIAQGIVIENCNLHDMIGLAGGNYGGAFLQGCESCIVRNNVINSVQTLKNGAILPLADASNQNTAGLLMFRAHETTIENNQISNAYSGIYRKQAPTPELGGAENRSIYRRNVIHDVVNGVRYSIAGAGNGGHFNQEFSENIVFNADTGVTEDSSQAISQGGGIDIFNNTIIANTALNLSIQQNVTFYNNILVTDTGTPSIRLNAPRQICQLIPPAPLNCNPGLVRPQVSLIDFNLFFDAFDGEPRFTFDAGAHSVAGTFFPQTPQVDLGTLASWQATAPTFAQPIPAADVNSNFADPQFTVVAGQLFVPQVGGPADNAGRVGGLIANPPVDIGAYPNGVGGSVVGPLKRPQSPTVFSGVGG